MKDIVCIAGPYASHDLAHKNAKFTMKLSATRHTALGRCGESRRSNTLTVTSSLSQYAMYSVCKQTAYTMSSCRRAFLYVHIYTCEAIVPKKTKKSDDWAINNFRHWCAQCNKAHPEHLLDQLPWNIEELSFWLARYACETRSKVGAKYPASTVYTLSRLTSAHVTDRCRVS